ncbi:unnamed protein product, partial [Vicia faba]
IFGSLIKQVLYPTKNGLSLSRMIILDFVTYKGLLKEKSEVGQIIQNFCKLVQTRFNTQIQVFRTDNGIEFFNKIVGNFFLENGIVHQSSCVNSPQQNGIAQRKNGHLLEVAHPNKMGLHRGKTDTFLKLHTPTKWDCTEEKQTPS